MKSVVKCRLCEKTFFYETSQVQALGEHILAFHPDASIAQFTFGSSSESPFVYQGEEEKIPEQSSLDKLKRQNMYRTTVETWKPGLSSLKCQSCSKVGQPLIKKQQNKVAQSSLGALCLLGCWPLCFLPFILGGSNLMNLYCKYCGSLLGTYDRKTGQLAYGDDGNVTHMQSNKGLLNSCCRRRREGEKEDIADVTTDTNNHKVRSSHSSDIDSWGHKNFNECVDEANTTAFGSTSNPYYSTK